MGQFNGHDWRGAQYLLVDDCPWEFFKCRKQLLGGQAEFTCTEKYRPLMKIKFGKPVIYLCNEDVRADMTENERRYYADNCVFVTFGENDKFY